MTRFTSPHFHLRLRQFPGHTAFTFRLRTNLATTRSYPRTAALLQAHLPTVLSTACFNIQNLPFAVKVKNTVIAHLFEHILLDYLYQAKKLSGSTRTAFAGRTTWNWTRDPAGLFHITVDAGTHDRDIFTPALTQSLNLMDKILTSNHL